MNPASRLVLLSLLVGAGASGQNPSAARIQPNLVDNIARPLRYTPDGQDFVIENGGEFFNRPLYGGNTAFRVDAGDQPEFSRICPDMAAIFASGSKPLAAQVAARSRPRHRGAIAPGRCSTKSAIL